MVTVYGRSMKAQVAYVVVWRFAHVQSDNAPVSIFTFHQAHASRDEIGMAQNALRRLRMLRYPHILKFLETAEHQGTVYLVVERVVPLVATLREWKEGASRDASSSAWIAWGLSHIAQAVAFLNDQARGIHGNIHAGSVFVSPAGEWLLGGFESFSGIEEDNAAILRYGGIPPHARVPPETAHGWYVLQDMPIHAVDSYGVCMLALEAYNDSVPATVSQMTPGRVPRALYPLLRGMAHPNPASRLSAAGLVARGLQPGGFLASNEFVETSTLLENFRVLEATEKEGVLATINTMQARLAPSFARHKVLPVLVEAFHYKSGTPPHELKVSTALLPLMLQIGASMSTPEWCRVLSEPILGAYASNCPPMVTQLLVQLPLYIEHLDAKAVTRLWPVFAQSFHGPEPLREAALQSVMLFLPKFSERIVNNELLRELAKMQKATQPPLRLMTTELLGQLTPHLRPSTKADVLVPAFASSLKDTYEQTRLAGITAFQNNEASFDFEAAARQVIPVLAPCLVDDNKEVREATHAALQMYLDKAVSGAANMSSVAHDMPVAPSEAPPLPADKPQRASTFSAFLTATAGSAATKLSDWALAQIEDEDPLVAHVHQAVHEEGTKFALPEPLPDVPRMDTPPAFPVHSQGMSLGKKAPVAERISQAFHEDIGSPTQSIRLDGDVAPRLPMAPATGAATPAQAPAPRPTSRPSTRPPPAPRPGPTPATARPPPRPAPSSSTLASKVEPGAAPRTSGLSKEEKLAQLQRLREERRAVRTAMHAYPANCSAQPRQRKRTGSVMTTCMRWIHLLTRRLKSYTFYVVTIREMRATSEIAIHIQPCY